MNNKIDFDLEFVEEAINDIKNDPWTLENNNEDNAEKKYITLNGIDNVLNKFYAHIYKKNLFDNKWDTNFEKIKDKKIEELTYNEILTYFTYIQRIDVSIPNVMYGEVKSGTILKLLERLKNIIIENETINNVGEIQKVADSETNNEEKNNLILKVQHLPFHSAYGIIEELKKNKPKEIVTEHIIKKDGLYNFDGVSVKVIELTGDYVKFELLPEVGLYGYNPKETNIITLEVNERIVLHRDVYDAEEMWKITFINKNVAEKEWKKCPICGEELFIYVYGLIKGHLPYGYISGGCEVGIDNPKYKCINCNKDFYEEKQDVLETNSLAPIDFGKSNITINETYIGDDGLTRDKEINLSIPSFDTNNATDSVIIVNINNYRLVFNVSKGNTAWLDFSDDDNPKKYYHCIMPLLLFKEYKQKIYSMTKNWEKEYKEENNKALNDIKWSLRELSGGQVIKLHKGYNGFPENWNEFIEYLQIIEKICKINSK